MIRIYILLLFLIFSCAESRRREIIEIQGHRGARGLAPENSIPAFLLATELGVNTLELDLVVTKDKRLLVSHEPYISPEICLDTSKQLIRKDSVINIYHLTYEDILKFDCGSLGNTRFSQQRKIPVSKPLLESVIDSVESYIYKTDLIPVHYNIELKTKNSTDDIFHPIPSQFSDLVYQFIDEKNLIDRVTIQSFDFRALQYFHSTYPEVKLVLLIENNLSWNKNIDSLGFIPDTYSPFYKLLSQKNVIEIQKAGMRVIPWTVNEISDIHEILDLGVDGIITDYPDRALNAINRR